VVPGSRFSFCYPHGERKGQRRTVRLNKWLAGDLFEVFDEDVGETRYYHALDTYGVEYLYLEVTPGEPQEIRRGSDSQAPGRRAALVYRSAEHSRRTAKGSRNRQPESRGAASGSGGATTVSIVAPEDLAAGGSPQEISAAQEIPQEAVAQRTGDRARLVWQERSLARSSSETSQRRFEDHLMQPSYASYSEDEIEERFSDLPYLKLRVNPDIAPALIAVLSRARRTIDTKQYLMDHSEGFSILEQSIHMYGTKIRILHDQKMFNHSSCVQENDRLRELANIACSYDRGSCLEFRTLKPPTGGLRCQHSKTWIIDGRYYVGGSANFTGASEGNFEENIFTRDAGVLADAKAAFEAAWSQGKVITLEQLLALESRRAASRSQSLARA